MISKRSRSQPIYTLNHPSNHGLASGYLELMPNLMISAAQLTKVYATSDGKSVQALHGIDLAVPSGEIYALLGPNGAGKTTTLSILTTLVLPTSGHARVAGYDVVTQADQVRRHIGVTFQEIVLDQQLTGRQILDFHGKLYGQSSATRRANIAELAQLVELEPVLDRKASGYSGGMKRRLELARGLMTTPDVLFLDEPTQGLDPQNRASVWTYIRKLRAERGLTLILTTHYMEEAEALADRVGIIDHGKLITEGVPEQLIRGMGSDVIVMRVAGNVAPLHNQLESEAFVTSCNAHTAEADLHILQVGVDHGNRRLAQLVEQAHSHSLQILEIEVKRPSLADVFLKHTGHTLRDS
jgi:ABC-2 type transport system ATP-binding protein